MSAPVQEPDDGAPKDGSLNYAPKKVRHPEPDPNPAGASGQGGAASRSPGAESAEPPWKRPKQRTVFAGDVAIAQLRGKLALAPDRLPDPPPPPSAGRKYKLAGRLAGVVVVAAVGVIGYRLGSAPPSPPPPALQPSQSDQRASAPRRSAASAPQTAEPASTSAAAAIVPQSNEQRPSDATSSRTVPRQLTVEAVRPQEADQAARLAVSATDAGPNADVMISGLAPGSALSAGAQVGPNAWQLPVEELVRAVITPPRGFVGAMDLTLELHLADNTVADRKSLQLEWLERGGVAPARSQPRPHSAAEIALMMKSGAELMANGDISGARLMYQRLAEAGEALAAFALAETYDPLVLRKSNISGGITPDVALAQNWYKKAKALGSSVAAERLERLARLP